VLSGEGYASGTRDPGLRGAGGGQARLQRRSIRATGGCLALGTRDRGNMSISQVAVPEGGVAAPADVLARIERLPLSSWQIRTRIIVGTATFFDGFDALSIAYVLPTSGRCGCSAMSASSSAR